MAHGDVSRRRFLAGTAVAAAELGLLALGGPAAARSIRVPTPTVPPIPARHVLKRLLPPVPPCYTALRRRVAPNAAARPPSPKPASEQALPVLAGNPISVLASAQCTIARATQLRRIES